MPGKRAAPPGTLGFLADSASAVYVVCARCGRFTVANLQSIAQRAGWGARVSDIGGRLVCKECGHRGARLTTERPRLGQAVCPRCGRPST